MVIQKAAALLLSVMLTAGAAGGAADVSIEQTQCTMPEIQVCIHADDTLLKGNVTAFLDGEELGKPQVQKYRSSPEPIHYYFILDDTGSVSYTYVPGIKEAMYDFGAGMRSQDEITVYTIGDKATQLYAGPKVTDDYYAAIDTYSNKGNTTYLYEALAQIADKSQAQSADGMRRSVVIAITDGVNESVASSLYDEAMGKLKEQQIPVYAVGLGNDQEGLDSFGRLARDTNGTIALATSAEVKDVILDTADSLLDDYILKVQAPNNFIGGDKELLLKFKDYSLTKSVMLHPVHWIPDREAPAVLSVEKTGSSGLRVNFSEAVTGAELPDNYTITFRESKLPVSVEQASYDEAGHFAELELGTTLYAGQYAVQLRNIADVSQEANLISGEELTVELEGPTYTTVQPRSLFMVILGDYWWACVIGFLLLFGVVILIVVMVNKGKHKEDTGEKDGLCLHFDIKDPENGMLELEVSILESLTVGRSGQSDVRLTDKRVSRRHFCLTRNKNQILISDCGSLSGTKVNGQPVQSNFPLNSKDTITAGLTEITIRW